MTGPFGAAPFAVVREERRPGTSDMGLVRDRLAALVERGPATLLLAEPLGTAAFSRRDQLLPGYTDAERLVAAHGFAPIVRPVGGHLAVYGEGSLVLHLWARHLAARQQIRPRFALLAEAMATGLRSLGVDARVGPVPSEYCDGEFSVNSGGHAKLVGTGQRIVGTGFLCSAVVSVHSAEPARAALTEAYGALGLPFDPATVGCVADSVAGVTVEEVAQALLTAMAPMLEQDAPATVEPALASC